LRRGILNLVPVVIGQPRLTKPVSNTYRCKGGSGEGSNLMGKPWATGSGRVRRALFGDPEEVAASKPIISHFGIRGGKLIREGEGDQRETVKKRPEPQKEAVGNPTFNRLLCTLLD